MKPKYPTNPPFITVKSLLAETDALMQQAQAAQAQAQAAAADDLERTVLNPKAQEQLVKHMNAIAQPATMVDPICVADMRAQAEKASKARVGTKTIMSQRKERAHTALRAFKLASGAAVALMAGVLVVAFAANNAQSAPVKPVSAAVAQAPVADPPAAVAQVEVPTVQVAQAPKAEEPKPAVIENEPVTIPTSPVADRGGSKPVVVQPRQGGSQPVVAAAVPVKPEPAAKPEPAKPAQSDIEEMKRLERLANSQLDKSLR